MNVLFILNDAPIDPGRSINALRLACSMSMRSSVYVRIFLLGSAIECARRPRGSRIDADGAAALITAVIRHGGDVRVCEPGADEQDEYAGELVEGAGELIEGASVSSLNELSHWIPEADRLLVF